MQTEGGVLRLDVDGQARRREEAVALAVAPSKVGGTTEWEGEVRVLRGHGGDDVVRRGEGEQEPAGLAVAADPSKVALDTRRGGVAVAATFDGAVAIGRWEVAELQPLIASQGCAVTKGEALSICVMGHVVDYVVDLYYGPCHGCARAAASSRCCLASGGRGGLPPAGL